MIVQNKKTLASILFILISFVCTAAQRPEPPQPAPMGAPPPPGLPIDGGLIFLFAVAIIYGAYKSFKLFKKSTEV